MQEFSRKDIIYAWNLNLPVIIFKEGKEVCRGTKINNPEMENLLGLMDHTYFVPLAQKNKLLKYLTGQLFIGILCGYVFSVVSFLFLIMVFFGKDVRSMIVLLPFPIMCASLGVFFIKMAKRSHKKICSILYRKS